MTNEKFFEIVGSIPNVESEVVRNNYDLMREIFVDRIDFSYEYFKRMAAVLKEKLKEFEPTVN